MKKIHIFVLKNNTFSALSLKTKSEILDHKDRGLILIQ